MILTQLQARLFQTFFYDQICLYFYTKMIGSTVILAVFDSFTGPLDDHVIGQKWSRDGLDEEQTMK